MAGAAPGPAAKTRGAPSSSARARIATAWRISFVSIVLLYPKSRLLPGKDRLLQIAHTGVASGEHLAELIDHRGCGSMDQPALIVKPDHPPRALGYLREVKSVLTLDRVEVYPMH